MENQVILADFTGRSEGVTETMVFGAVTYITLGLYLAVALCCDRMPI